MQNTIAELTENNSVLADSNESLERKISEIEEKDKIPLDSIVLFDAEACPEGWSEFEKAFGRVIIGAGKGEHLSNRTHGDKGGSESILLMAENIPKHTHSTAVRGASNGARGPSSGVPDLWQGSRAGFTGSFPADDATPISSLPPFIVLTVCKKGN